MTLRSLALKSLAPKSPAPKSLTARSRIVLVGLSLMAASACCSSQDYTRLRTEEAPAAIAIERRLAMPPSADPELANLDAVPVIRLKGDGYSRGHQYGRLFKEDWQKAVREVEAQAVREIKPYTFYTEWIARIVYRSYTNSVFNDVDDGDEGAEQRMPEEYRGYVQGLADGAELELAQLTRLIATVMVSDASCCGFIAVGPATEDGRLIQSRNLDWGDDVMRPQQATILAIHEPEDGYRYLSIGFVGLIGSVSGINEHGISLTEVGSNSADKTRAGTPMPLMLERVLAEAKTLDEAIAIMRETPGTGGYNFLIGSAKERVGAAVEKNASRTAVFRIGEKNYQDNPHFEDLEGFDCRADTAADPQIRRFQLCSGGDPDADSPPPPTASRAYRTRYKPQVELFDKRFKRTMTIEAAEAIVAETAPKDNLHSIIYDFERRRVYLRNRAWLKSLAAPTSPEKRRLRAALQGRVEVDLDLIFPKTRETARR